MLSPGASGSIRIAYGCRRATAAVSPTVDSTISIR
jgi:hypothetical protein